VSGSNGGAIWVLTRVADGKLANPCLELLGAARRLADSSGAEVGALLLGAGVKGLVAEAGSYGADVVYVVDDPVLEKYRTAPYVKAITALAKEHAPAAILIPGDVQGRDLSGALAAALETGLAPDCVDLDIDTGSGLLRFIRPTFGGSLLATVECPEARPQMGTIRPKAFPVPDADASRQAREVVADIALSEDEVPTKVTGFISGTGAVNLTDADVIVSGGRGMGAPENFAKLQEFADVVGGAIGASRAAVDAGWIEYAHQVGQTGKSVKPKLYFAFGISGAIQHIAGMRTSDVIVAVNKDPNAPIFKVANFGVVGNVLEILPMMTTKFKEALGK
jgi:electron transfer flavoprotein alpha subunit